MDGMHVKQRLTLCYFLGTGTENLHVSQILQKAKIEVSEDGTKASAATSRCWVIWQGWFE
jgi:serine protease inhibitor